MTPEFPNTEQILERFKQALVDSLQSKGVRPDSKLAQSFEVTKDVQALKTDFEVIANEYWFYVDQGRGPTEQGTRPGKVKELVRDWIRRNGIVAEERNGKTPTEDELVFLITRKIHREGFPGRDFVAPVFEQYEDDIFEATLKDIDLNFDNFVKNIF